MVFPLLLLGAALAGMAGVGAVRSGHDPTMEYAKKSHPEMFPDTNTNTWYDHQNIRPQAPMVNEADAMRSFRQGEHDFTNRNDMRAGGQFPSLAEIMAQLERLQNPGSYMTDPANIAKQARAAADAQYNPLIAGLRIQKSQSEARGQRNKEELGRMFSSLGTSLEADIPGMQQQFQQTKDATAKEYQNLQSNITGQYAQTQADQEALLKRLGIEAAGAETLPQQQRDKDFFVNTAATQGQTMQSAIGQEERGATEWTRKGGQQARIEGTQRQADLMNAIMEMAQTYDSQIGSNEAARESAYQSNLGQLNTQAQSQATDSAQNAFNNYLKSISLARDLRNDERSLTSQAPTAVKSIADVANRSLGLGLDQAGAQRVQNVFSTTLQSNPLVRSGVDPNNNNVPYSDQAMAAMMMEQGRNQGLSQSELNALYTAALEFFGKR